MTPGLRSLLCIGIALLAWPIAWPEDQALSRSGVAASTGPQAQIAPWGFDLNGMDENTAPGRDFYKFANGTWAAQAVIAPDEWQAGPIIDIWDLTDKRAAELTHKVLGRRWEESSDEAKFVRIYRSYLDRSTSGRRQPSPIRALVQHIGQARTREDIAERFGNFRLNANGLFGVALRVDPLTGEGYIPSLEPTGLILGGKFAYLRDDPASRAVRSEASGLLVSLLRASGARRNARTRVERILALETQIANLLPDPAIGRDPQRSLTRMSPEMLAEKAPGFAWAIFLEKAGLGHVTAVDVASEDSLIAMTELFAATPVSVLKDYLRLRLMIDYGPFLRDNVARRAEALSALRRGTEYVRPSRSDRARELAHRLIPDVLARAYVAEYVNPQILHDVEAMAEMVRGAYGDRIRAASWLSAPTRERALAKLDKLDFIIGTPPGWNDYADYNPREETLFGNVYWSDQLRHESSLWRLNNAQRRGPADIETLRSHIFFSPLRTGAYYLPRLNTVILPAAYLQAPYYDPGADPAVNFGALGTTIGHEIAHAFDDQGSKFDENGKLQNWWGEADRAAFERIGAEMSLQFSQYEAAGGLLVNPGLTLGENLSDLVGVEVALQAWERMARDRGLADAERREGQRRFFLAYAQKRRSVRREHVAMGLALRDPHSPPVHRVNGILRNVDAWYDTFGVGPDDALWLAPEARVRLW